MSHPYENHEGTKLWAAIAAEIAELEKNQDVTLTTVPHYVIGALCQRLVEDGLVRDDRNSDVQTNDV